METIAISGRQRLIAWVVILLLLLVATRLTVVLIAVNGREELPSQLLSDAIAAVMVLYIAFSGDRLAKWLGVLLFGVWGLFSLWIAVSLGGAATFSLQGEIVVLLAAEVWRFVVQALAVLTAVVCLGFAGVLALSPSINRYFAFRRSPRA